MKIIIKPGTYGNLLGRDAPCYQHHFRQALLWSRDHFILRTISFQYLFDEHVLLRGLDD